MNRTGICILLLVFSVASGCFLGGGHEVEARVPTEGKKISVVPFREKDLYFLESKVGAQVAGLVAQVILKDGFDAKIFDPSPAFDLIKDKNPRTIDWGEVAKKLKVDYIIVGNILEYRARDPVRDVNCYRGQMAVEVTVWRPDKSMALAETVTAVHPSGRFSAEVISPFDTTEEQVLGHLQAKTALKIARLFFPHTPEDN